MNSSTWPIDGTLIGTTTPGQSKSASNCHKGILHIPQSSRTEVTPSNGQCHIQYTRWEEGPNLLQRCSLFILQPRVKNWFKPVYFYHFMYSVYCLHFYWYFHNVSVDVSFSLLHAKLRSLHRTLNWTLYSIYRGRFSNFLRLNWVQVLSYSKYSLLFTCSWDWTCNLQMVSLRSSLTKCQYPLRLQLIILSKQLYLQVTIPNTNNLHAIIHDQIFMSYTNNFQIDLFDP